MKKATLWLMGTFIAWTLLAQEKKSGVVFRDCKDCPEMVIIPAGSFLMGSPATETGRTPEEGPQRKVTVPALAVAKYPITRGQWAAFVAATGRKTNGGCAWSELSQDTTMKPWDLNPAASWNHLGFIQTEDDPVVCITWADVADYLSWMNQKTGKSYRLPTEAEWEYAARSGSTTPYYWGNAADHQYANYGADSGYKGLAQGRDRWMNTSPVGSFPPNSFGLFDMTGNVDQYVQDYFIPSYQGLPTDASAYRKSVVLSNLSADLSFMNGTSSDAYRMIRGGNYGDPPAMLRIAYRNWTPGPGADLQRYASAGLGFRIVRSL